MKKRLIICFILMTLAGFSQADELDVLFVPAIIAASHYNPPPPVKPGWELIKEKGGFGDRAWHRLLSFENKLWIIGGECRYGTSGCPEDYELRDVWNSSNGRTWSLVSNNLPANALHTNNAIIFQNKIWVWGTYGPLIEQPGDPDLYGLYNSSDGKTWTKVNISPSGFGLDYPLFVHDNKLWSFQNKGRRIYNSSDGITWSLVTQNPEFINHVTIERFNYQVLSFNGKLWVIGGYYDFEDTTKNISYVYSSNDGINWTLITDNAAFKGRIENAVVVYNNKMWVIGGFNGGPMDEAWWSRDGINWSQEKHTPRFSARVLPAVTTHSGKIYLVGGYLFSSDIWTYEE